MQKQKQTRPKLDYGHARSMAVIKTMETAPCDDCWRRARCAKDGHECSEYKAWASKLG